MYSRNQKLRKALLPAFLLFAVAFNLSGKDQIQPEIEEGQYSVMDGSSHHRSSRFAKGSSGLIGSSKTGDSSNSALHLQEVDSFNTNDYFTTASRTAEVELTNKYGEKVIARVTIHTGVDQFTEASANIGAHTSAADVVASGIPADQVRALQK